MADWYISNGSVPYRENFPEPYESEKFDPHEKWLGSNIKWHEKTWPGSYKPTYGKNVWSDGSNIYYSGGSTQYVLDKSTSTWVRKTWSGSYTPAYGYFVWTDGERTYYSNSYVTSSTHTHSVLNKSTGAWVKKYWNINLINGPDVWTDGTDIYCTCIQRSGQYIIGREYVLDKSTGEWRAKDWGSPSPTYGRHIWTDGSDIYYSDGSYQYVLNRETSTWSSKTWTGSYKPTYGKNVWSDGKETYYSNDTEQYILNKSTGEWIPKEWSNNTSFNGDDVWTDGDYIYCSNASGQYVLTSTIVPYRLDFPETNESESHIDYTDKWVITDDIPYRLDFPLLKDSKDAKHDWYIDDDIPFQGGFPELHESDKFDLHGEWVSDKEVENTGDLVFLKLTIPFTVTVASGSDSFTLSTPFDNRKINYFDSRKNYGTRDCQLSIKLPYNVPIYQMDFTQSNDIVSSVGSAGLYLFPRSDTPTTGRCTYQNTNYASESHVVSYKNTELVEPEYNSYYDSYLCVGEFDCRTVQNDHKSGTTEFTYGFIFAFHSNIPTDMDKYDRMLEYYDGYIEPFYYTRSSVPYRLDFPSLKSSIDAKHDWYIDDDIPYRLDFPELLESIEPPSPTFWLQYAGYVPYRPWPGKIQIPNIADTVEIPEIDWTKSMQQTFEYFTVDPKTWYDDKQLFQIISSNHSIDLTSDLRGSATISTNEPLGENYIRTYMVCKQGRYTHRVCLGTYLYMTSDDSFNGIVHTYTMTGYTPLVELQESMPPIGFFIYGQVKKGDEAPLITDEIKKAILENTRCELEMNVTIPKPLLNNFVAGTDDNWLTVVNNLLSASNEARYMLIIDEWGTLQLKNSPIVSNMQPTFVYDDSNSSILLPEVNTGDDLFQIPNTVELIFVGNTRFRPCRKIVKNEDEASPVSVQNRGREIVKRYTISNIAIPASSNPTQEMIEEMIENQAYTLLETASTIQKTISYSHGYCGTKVGDCVMINYERAGLSNVKAVITSQKINCTPGCQVDETASYTKKYFKRN